MNALFLPILNYVFQSSFYRFYRTICFNILKTLMKNLKLHTIEIKKEEYKKHL